MIDFIINLVRLEGIGTLCIVMLTNFQGNQKQYNLGYIARGSRIIQKTN